jgi:hypothetical protein
MNSMKPTPSMFLGMISVLLFLATTLCQAQPLTPDQRVNCSRNACASIRDRLPSCILSIKNPGSGGTELPVNNVQGKAETAQQRPIDEEDGVWGCRSIIADEYAMCIDDTPSIIQREQPSSKNGAASSAKPPVVMQTKPTATVQKK